VVLRHGLPNLRGFDRGSVLRGHDTDITTDEKIGIIDFESWRQNHRSALRPSVSNKPPPAASLRPSDCLARTVAIAPKFAHITSIPQISALAQYERVEYKLLSIIYNSLRNYT